MNKYGALKMEDIENIGLQLPDSVVNPKPIFTDASKAIHHYVDQLQKIAQTKELSIDELQIQANAYKFGADESFRILGLFDIIQALKSAVR